MTGIERTHPRTMAEIDTAGLRIVQQRHNRHIVAKLSNGAVLTFAATPSDARADLNQRAVLRRLLSKAVPADPQASFTPQATPDRPWDAVDWAAEQAEHERAERLAGPPVLTEYERTAYANFLSLWEVRHNRHGLICNGMTFHFPRDGARIALKQKRGLKKEFEIAHMRFLAAMARGLTSVALNDLASDLFLAALKRSGRNPTTLGAIIIDDDRVHIVSLCALDRLAGEIRQELELARELDGREASPSKIERTPLILHDESSEMTIISTSIGDGTIVRRAGSGDFENSRGRGSRQIDLLRQSPRRLSDSSSARPRGLQRQRLTLFSTLKNKGRLSSAGRGRPSAAANNNTV